MLRSRMFGLLLAVTTALFLLVVGVLFFGHSIRPAAAQSNGLRVEKTLLKSSNVVMVGETLTFAITITNNWHTTVITLPVVDTYDRSVLAYINATPAEDSHNASTGVINWDNILATTGPLAPGEQVVILVRFTAEHPSPRVVNHAATHDAYDSLGNLVGDGEAEHDNEAVGGNTPLEKTLDAGVLPQAGQRITFTIRVQNAGLVDVVRLPLEDTFDPTALQFIASEPMPDTIEPGKLTWANLLTPPRPVRLPPNEFISITTVFTALKGIEQTTNSARVVGAGDSFGNNLAPAADDVPIRIIAGPATATPTRTPRPTPAATAINQATATSVVSATEVVITTPTIAISSTATIEAIATLTPGQGSGSTATPTVIPAVLPDTSTGSNSPSNWWLGAAILAILLLGIGLNQRSRG